MTYARCGLQSMRINLDARVFDVRSEEAGSVHAVILDRPRAAVTGAVIGTSLAGGHSVIAPRAAIAETNAEGTELRLAIAAAELAGMAVFNPEHYVPPAGELAALASTGFLRRVYLGGSARERSTLADRRGAGGTKPAEIVLTPDTMVVDRDGEYLGAVDAVVFDADTGAVRGYGLRLGSRLRTLFGGGDAIAIPVSFAARFEPSFAFGVVKALHLSVPKKMLSDVRRR